MPILAPALVFECLTRVSSMRLFSSSRLAFYSLASLISFSSCVCLRLNSFSITSAASTTSCISCLPFCTWPCSCCINFSFCWSCALSYSYWSGIILWWEVEFKRNWICSVTLCERSFREESKSFCSFSWSCENMSNRVWQKGSPEIVRR